MIRCLIWQWFVCILMVGCFAGCEDGACDKISYEEIVSCTVDLERLAREPVCGYAAGQCSSYDRASRYDAQRGEYSDWSANGDGTGYIRKEGDSVVLCEIDGPGCIWRIWSAMPGDGPVEIYLDGSTVPALSMSFKDYFDNTKAPFNYPSMVYESARGMNCYVPVSFGKSCKVVGRGNWGKYYHFTYSRFDEDVVVETFSGELTDSQRAALKRADELLSKCGEDAVYGRSGKVKNSEVVLQSGQSGEVFVRESGGAIKSIRVLRDGLEGLGTDVLRDVIFKIYWDGADEAAVCCPLLDFFGSYDLAGQYKSLPMGVTDENLYSYWYMPFTESARVVVENESDAGLKLGFEFVYDEIDKPADGMYYFYAQWHRGAYDYADGRPIDWRFLDVQGRGRFCGIMLHVWNPMGGWWGEGDEKFFVDGEKFPSVFGTGTEDYFGYAWCSEELFSRAYHNQPVSVAKNPCACPDRSDSGGHTCNSRFHISDDVPFDRGFEGAFEKYFSTERLTDYSASVYFYLDEPGKTVLELPGKGQRGIERYRKDKEFVELLETLEGFQVGDSIEAVEEKAMSYIKDDYYGNYREQLLVLLAGAESVSGNAEKARELFARSGDNLSEPFVRRSNAEVYFNIMGRDSGDGGVEPLLVNSGDGSVKRVKYRDEWAIMTSKAEGRHFLYFDVPDDVDFERGSASLVRVRAFSSAGADNIELHYDSNYSSDVAGIYHLAAVESARDDGGMVEKEFLCDNVFFGGRENSRSDFRIFATNEDIYVYDVEVIFK